MGTHRARPLVSVVVPTYNRERFLRSCIDSALAQDYSPFEVIVVDDGSTDGTRELCASYGARIRYFRKPNGGAASALNAGVGEMRGRWFKWLSSDDELEPGALEALVDEGERTGAGVVFGDYRIIDAGGRVMREHRERRFGSQEEFVVGLWRHFVGSASAAIISAPSLRAVGGFDETLRYAEDYDWWLRAALVQGVRFSYLPRTVARYRVHPGQVTAQKLLETARLRARLKARVSRTLREGEGPDPRLRAYYSALTRRYRRILGPLVAVRSLAARTRAYSKGAYWAGKLAPGLSARVHWAAEPPVPP
jgi:glycosyltransferase involved in cell wall biosynthesis